MTTDFTQKQSLKQWINRHLSLKNPAKVKSKLSNVIPAHALDHIEIILQDHQIILMTNETWYSWLKIRLQSIKSQLPKHLKLIITLSHHEPLQRPALKPSQLSLNTEDAQHLQQLGENMDNPRLQKALIK